MVAFESSDISINLLHSLKQPSISLYIVGRFKKITIKISGIDSK